MRTRDLADDHAELHVLCRQCQRMVTMPGSLLVARYGPDALLAGLVARMRCKRDGMIPDVFVVLDHLEADREAYRRKVDAHPPSITTRR